MALYTAWTWKMPQHFISRCISGNKYEGKKMRQSHS